MKNQKREGRAEGSALSERAKLELLELLWDADLGDRGVVMIVLSKYDASFKKLADCAKAACAPQGRIEINDVCGGVEVSASVKDEWKLLQAAEKLVRMAAKRKGEPAWQLWEQVFHSLASRGAEQLPHEPYREPEQEDLERIDKLLGHGIRLDEVF